MDLPTPRDGHLGPWSRRGVLLLNTTLTVEDGKPGSHARLGWERLTDAIIEAVAADAGPKVFMLWGAHAQSKASIVEAVPGKHRVLQCNHPSPLSARRSPMPFVGCRHFSAANAFLEETGLDGVDWSLS